MAGVLAPPRRRAPRRGRETTGIQSRVSRFYLRSVETPDVEGLNAGREQRVELRVVSIRSELAETSSESGLNERRYRSGRTYLQAANSFVPIRLIRTWYLLQIGQPRGAVEHIAVSLERGLFVDNRVTAVGIRRSQPLWSHRMRACRKQHERHDGDSAQHSCIVGEASHSCGPTEPRGDTLQRVCRADFEKTRALFRVYQVRPGVLREPSGPPMAFCLDVNRRYAYAAPNPSRVSGPETRGASPVEELRPLSLRFVSR